MIEELDLDIPDDAMAEIIETAPDLNARERRFLYWRSVGIPPIEAFRRAGYSGSAWRTVETRPRIRTALADLHEKLAPEYRVTQQKVIGILMEAVDMARIKEQPKVMVEAATALANVSGVAAASKVQIDSRTNISIDHRKQEIKAIKHMPREGLEQMVGVSRLLPEKIVEAEIIESEITEE